MSTETPAQRRERLARVFGDVLPETTADEREAGDQPGHGWGPAAVRDAELRRDVPPHHG